MQARFNGRITVIKTHGAKDLSNNYCQAHSDLKIVGVAGLVAPIMRVLGR